MNSEERNSHTSSHANEDESPLMSRQVYAEEPRRIWNLVLYILISTIAEIQFFGSSLITTQISQLYGVSLTMNFWYSSAFFVCPLILFFPAGIFASTYSVKSTLLFGLCLALAGSWLKCLINTSYFFNFAGQYLVAAAYTFFRTTVTKMSSQWFSTTNRPLSTSIISISQTLFDLFSMFLPTLAINVDLIPHNKESYFRERYAVFHVICALVFTLVGVFSIIFYKEAPRQIVSASSGAQRASLHDSFTLIKQNRSTLLATISIAMMTAIYDAFLAIFGSAFSKYGATTLQVRFYSLVSFPFVLVFTLGVSILSGRTGKFKIIILAGNTLIFAAFLCLIFLYKLEVSAIFGVFIIMHSTAFAWTYTVGMEFLAQLSFPTPEPLITTFLYVLLKIIALILIQASAPLIEHNYILCLLLIFLVLSLVTMVLLLLVKEKLERRNLDFQTMDRQRELQ